jgi:hypothetical protein
MGKKRQTSMCMTRMQWPWVVMWQDILASMNNKCVCVETIKQEPVHLLYFTVAPGFNTIILQFYSPTVYSRYDQFCFIMLFTYCVFLVVINCGLHPLLYISEAVHTALVFTYSQGQRRSLKMARRCRNM